MSDVNEDPRRWFKHDLGEEMVIEIRGERFRWTDCWHYAEQMNLLANVTEAVLKTRDGRYIKVTVVAAVGQVDAYGIRDGFYVAQFVPAEIAEAYYKAWSALTPQRGEPPEGSPWSS